MIIDNKELKDFFIGYGFTESEYKTIITSHGVEPSNEQTTKSKIKALFEFFSNYYTDAVIRKILVKAPSLSGYTVETLEAKIKDLVKLGFDLETVIKMGGYFPQLYTYSVKTIQDKIEDFKTLGYKKREVIKLFSKNPKFLGESVELLEKKIANIMTLGFTREEVVKKAKQSNAFYAYTFDAFKDRVKDIANLGYGKTERTKPEELSEGEKKAIVMIKRTPTILNRSKETLENKIIELTTLGFTKDEVIKITYKQPSLFGQRIDTLEKKKEGLINLGFNEEKFRKTVVGTPSTIVCKTKSISKKIDAYIKNGYTREEVINSAAIFPSLLSKSVKTINKICKFYNSIGMHDLLTTDSKQFMQSVEVSYARYMFLRERGKTVDIEHYKDLFRGNKEFEERFGISKDELLNRYKYNGVKSVKGFGGLK